MERLLTAQVALRRYRHLTPPPRSSRLPAAKTLETFDFSFQPNIDRAQILNLHELGFVECKENVIFLGPGRVGKTPSRDLPGDYSGRTRTSRLLRHPGRHSPLALVEAERQGRLRERLSILRQPFLLVVDENGYLPVTSSGANLSFQLVNARYEKASFVLTSNKSFKDWAEVFGDQWSLPPCWTGTTATASTSAATPTG